MFIHSFQAVQCNVPVDNGRKDKPLRGKTSRCAFGGRAAHPLPSTRFWCFYVITGSFVLLACTVLLLNTDCKITKGRAMAPFGF